MPTAIHPRLREVAADATTRLDELHDAAWASVDPDLLELCRLRLAEILGDSRGLAEASPVDEVTRAALPEWWTSSRFGPTERAALAFTEQFATSVASLTDAEVDALRAELDDRTVYEFVSALCVLDLTTRVDLVTRAIFDGVSA